MRARLASLFVAALAAGSAAAQPPAGRVAVAESASPAATFCARSPGGTFRTLPEKAELFPGELLVGLPGGTITSKNGAVTVKSLADFDLLSPLPILDTAFSLDTPKDKDTDLDLTLDRGRVDVTNTKTAGAATVRVRFWDQNWKIVLDAPGSRVAVELCGRWPSGTRFKPAAPAADPARVPKPVASLVLLVLAGSAAVDVGGTTVAMKAPPGPAELRWNSLQGALPQPQKLDKLPKWADEAALSPDGKKAAAACEAFRAARAADPEKAVDGLLASPDPVRHRVALVTLGALDQLEKLGKSMIAARTLDEWDFGITVLRHWLGRAPGNDQRFYAFLTGVRGYTPAEARIIMQLLLGFTPEDLATPETYEVLIDYLLHEKPAVRNLAAWHLVRLVPQGKSIAFKPAGTADDARACHAAWKKLIPDGKLPPSAAKKGKN
jgi:hypothetical protein